jgi:EpsI family protein
MTLRVSVLALLVFCAGAWTRAAGPREIPLTSPLSHLPLRIATWRGVDAPPIDPEVARVLRADDYVNRVYAGPTDHTVALWIAFYASQRHGDAIHSPLNCLPGTGWVPVSREQQRLTVNGRSFPVNRYLVQRRGERQLVMYWYQGRGRIVASEYANKMHLLIDALQRQRTDGALVRVAAPVLNDPGEAERHASGFIAALYPELARWLP